MLKLAAHDAGSLAWNLVAWRAGPGGFCCYADWVCAMHSCKGPTVAMGNALLCSVLGQPNCECVLPVRRVMMPVLVVFWCAEMQARTPMLCWLLQPSASPRGLFPFVHFQCT